MIPTVARTSVLAITAGLLLNGTAFAQSHIEPGWAIGVRAEYVNLSGFQYNSTPSGMGLDVSVIRSLNTVVSLQAGISTSFHPSEALSYGVDEANRVAGGGTHVEMFATLYGGASFQIPLHNSRFAPYFGFNAGISSGDFSDAFYGIQGSVTAGALFRLSHRVQLDFSVAGKAMNVGPFEYTARWPDWGEQVGLRSGLVFKLGKL